MTRLKPRTMVADVQVIRPEERVVIAITHEDYQSFARAVYPRANREFQRVAKQYALSGPWSSYMDMTDERTEDGRCVSLVIYERRLPVTQ